MPKLSFRPSAAGATLLLAAASAQAALAVEAKVSGFASFVAGDVLTGPADVSPGNATCPCFTADWGNGLVYTGRRVEVTPESRAGAQLTLQLTDSLSLVAQAVGRAGTHRLSLEWAYLSYDVTPKLTVQAGKKRLPIFYYSDFQDVGYAYVWIRPPGELYGWDMNNYVGASVRYRENLGELTLNTSLFGGAAGQKDDLYFKPLVKQPVDVQWNNIRGADAEVTYDWLTTRLVYIQSVNRYDVGGQGWSDFGFNLGYDTRQSIYGLAVNADFGRVFLLSESNLIVHSGGLTDYRSPAYSVGGGYRLGKWTPFLNYSDYTDSTTTPSTYSPQRFDDWSLTVRYDLAKGQDVKLQYNRFRDLSRVAFNGNSQLVSASYDVSL